MEEKVNYVLVGLFALVLGAALIAGVLWFSSEKSYRKAYDVYLAYMNESVSGLTLDSPVLYRGVNVGRVRKIALVQGLVEQVQLTMLIERGTPIKEDTVAVLSVQGLTGVAHVELSGGSRDARPLQAHDPEKFPVIATGPSFLLRLDTSVSSLVASATRSSESFNALLDDENRRAFKRTLADLEILARTLAARSAAIDAGLANAARTMDNTARASGELPQLLARVDRSAEGFIRMADDVSRASNAVNEAAAGAHTDVRQFKEQTLEEMRAAIADLRELTASLRRVSEQMEQNPSMLLYGRAPAKPGPGE
jgi:phospholipid/cholesterol/gamma-HCH transport system substrate-binding protein